MADLKQALKWMVEGKRVKHSTWRRQNADPIYIHLHKNEIVDEKNIYCFLTLTHPEGWEMYIDNSHHCENDGYICTRLDSFLLNLKRINTNDMGATVNFCPFCGEN